jgi:hypothetical protein
MVGIIVGCTDGLLVGREVGANEKVGWAAGSRLIVGTTVGERVGSADGLREGSPVGKTDGSSVGSPVGSTVTVATVGAKEGPCVGYGFRALKSVEQATYSLPVGP